VDEVLAVGDAQFQKKCLGKMGDVAKEGRTVLFVSHALGTIATLCTRVLLFCNGVLSMSGSSRDVIATYLMDGSVSSDGQGLNLNKHSEGHPFVLHSVEVLDNKGNRKTRFSVDESIRVRLTFEVAAPMKPLRVGFRLHAQDMTVVLSTTDSDHLPDQCSPRTVGIHASEVEFPAHFLNIGRYYIWVGIDIPMTAPVLSLDQAACFSIEAVGGIAGVNDNRLGVLAPLLPWRTIQLSRSQELRPQE
jgi:lipopolysaccharide transport system ATP-binding protein